MSKLTDELVDAFSDEEYTVHNAEVNRDSVRIFVSDNNENLTLEDVENVLDSFEFSTFGTSIDREFMDQYDGMVSVVTFKKR